MPIPAEQFFRTNILVHTHVEKAAGTTFAAGLETVLGKERVRDDRLKKIKFPSLPAAERASYWAYSNHCRSSAQVDAPIDPELPALGLKNKVFMASVREPIERLVSYVKFVQRSDGNHPVAKAVSGRSVDEAVRNLIDMDRPITRNQQCVQIRGGPVQNFDEVQERIDSQYQLLFQHSSVVPTLEFIAEMLERSTDGLVERRNAGISPTTTAELSIDTQRLLLDRSELDAQLFDYVRTNEGVFREKLRSTLESLVD